MLKKVEIAEEQDIHEVVDPEDAAESAGLLYVHDDREPGITRRKSGTGWSFRNPDGTPIKDAATIARIHKLAVPPAYTDVWICPDPRGHIQATGRDDKGRKQYRYHAAFREVRDSAKYEHVTAFAAALPLIRATVRQHMGLHGLPRQKVLATVVYLLETTLIRVGNEGYAKQNQSYGLTTLEDRHVDAHGSELRFFFKGKSNKMWNLKLHDRRVAKIVKACHDLPGQHLFQYVDHDGHQHGVSSHDVNDYLREITGRDVSAKDFRTWAGTVLAALALQEFGTIDSEAKAKKNIRAAIEHVSSRLGNTPTICRKCYVHPAIVNSYLSGELLLEVKEELDAELRDDLPRLKPEEVAVLTLLERRIAHDLDAKTAEVKPAKTKRKRKAALAA
ncbi:MAG: DNA topoisomerase IB [Janthinobacterium lividum]